VFSFVTKWLPRVWLVVLLAMLVGVAYAVYCLWDLFVQFPAMLGDISLGEWSLIALGTALCFAFDFLRLYTLLAIPGYRLGLWTGLQTIAVSEFASIVTPTAELHIPATVYVLAHRDIPVAEATAAIVSKTLYMVMWVSLAGLVVLLAPGAPLPDRFTDYALYCTIPLALVVALFVIIIIFAERIQRLVDRRLNRSELKRWQRLAYGWLSRSTQELASIGTSTRPMHLFTHVCSVGYILAYCFLGYILCAAFGLAVTPDRALQVFTLSLVVLYIGIVPGSILVAELATAYLLDPGFVQQNHPALFVAVMLRFLSRYLLLLPGAAIFFFMLSKHGFRSFRSGETERVSTASG
jgi:uncharacterized protein (TIRG00374 family)